MSGGLILFLSFSRKFGLLKPSNSEEEAEEEEECSGVEVEVEVKEDGGRAMLGLMTRALLMRMHTKVRTQKIIISLPLWRRTRNGEEMRRRLPCPTDDDSYNVVIYYLLFNLFNLHTL